MNALDRKTTRNLGVYDHSIACIFRGLIENFTGNERTTHGISSRNPSVQDDMLCGQRPYELRPFCRDVQDVK